MRINSLWGYRHFILGNVAREFRAKYQNSVFGAAWLLITPIAMIIIYTVIFSQVIGAKMAGVASQFGYSIFLCSGILTWGLFSEIVSRSQSVFLDNANLLKKLQFPWLCLPTITVINASINFVIIFSIFTVFLVASGDFPGVQFFWLIPLIIILLSISVGLGVCLGILNVFFRDVGQFCGVFLQFWFWLTPIVYPLAILPKGMAPLVEGNPMTPLIVAFQGVLVHGKTPALGSLTPPILLGLSACIFAVFLTRRLRADLLDEI